MNFLNDSGLLYFWQKIKEKLSGKVDKVEGKGLSTNDYTNGDKAKVDKIITSGDGTKFLSNDGTYVAPPGNVKDVKVNGTSVVSNSEANIDLTNYAQITYVDDATDALETRIVALEELGQYVGSYDKYSDVPNNKSAFEHITINDFVNVRADENHGNLTTRYVATAINPSTGVITWTYDITYTTDVSGKMDLVTSAQNNRVATFTTGGQVQDSGVLISNIVLTTDITAISNSEIDSIMES